MVREGRGSCTQMGRGSLLVAADVRVVKVPPRGGKGATKGCQQSASLVKRQTGDQAVRAQAPLN